MCENEMAATVIPLQGVRGGLVVTRAAQGVSCWVGYHALEKGERVLDPMVCGG